jgi:excisionase family DNA binding protein
MTGKQDTSTPRTPPPRRAARAAAAPAADLFDAVVAAATEAVLAVLPEPPAATPWLDVQGAAEHLCCSKHRIYTLVSMRRIPHQHEGARLLFDRDELDEWIRAGGAK